MPALTELNQRIVTYQDPNMRRYTLILDDRDQIVEAMVHVQAHDKSPTDRKVVHKVTLAKLQAIVTPSGSCPHCNGSGLSKQFT